ncbi:hypothetical protein PVIIG_06086 [Plasmodium vivax India VII]|uniref:Variable surface protein Vir35 n=1 Tax=Plasmodium vivax India VII TaxID=1077284 RepID=A0A0J9SIN3_PLAVI|nr:hypothetical protein PVIIG_06086 [Plasmodium vivax India VII]CAI7724106.1 Protein of unknown function, putative [Plasmodium vivax]
MKGSNEYLVNEKYKFYFFNKLFTLITLTWICSYNFMSSFVILDNNTNKYGFLNIKINRILANDRLEKDLRSSGISSNISHNRAHGIMKRVELRDTENEYTVKSKQNNKVVYNSLKESRENFDYSSSSQKKKRSFIKKIDYHFEKKIFKTIDSIMQSRRSSKFDQYSFISFKNKKLRKITIPGTIILVIGLACMIAGKATGAHIILNPGGRFKSEINIPKDFKIADIGVKPLKLNIVHKNYSNISECENCTGCIFYIAGTTLLIMGLLIMVYISLKIYKYMEIQELKTSLSLKKN